MKGREDEREEQREKRRKQTDKPRAGGLEGALGVVPGKGVRPVCSQFGSLGPSGTGDGRPLFQSTPKRAGEAKSRAPHRLRCRRVQGDGSQ